MRRRVPLLLLAAVLAAAAPAARAEPVLLPPGFAAHLMLGMADAENQAARLRDTTQLELRYHYLAGGVNTGKGWTTWAQGRGSFVSNFIADSQASGFLPVFSLYVLRPSLPGAHYSSEPVGDLRNLRTRATMRAFFTQLRTFYERAAGAGGPVVLHVEPDLWGYVERAARGNASAVPAQVASTGLTDLEGLPNTAAGFAQAIVRMRNRYAPNVVLGYHVSIWGTGEDIALSDPTDARTDELARSAASFYRSLGAKFDVLFAEYTDRGAGYAQAIDHAGPEAWWTPEDFARHARFLADVSTALDRRVVLWQIPLGNRVSPIVDNTPLHYQDNRVEWLLGPSSRAHLKAYIDAGVIALLFGKAQPTDTCACDDDGDGVDDDGGYFKRAANAYYAAGALPLPARATRPPKARRRTGIPRLALTAGTSSSVVRRGKRLIVSLRITARGAARALVAVQLYPPGAVRARYQLPFRNQRFGATPRRLRLRFNVPANAARGVWQVKVGIFDPDWKKLYLWTENAARFTVR